MSRVLTAILLATIPAGSHAAAPGARGEKALRASFYLNTVPILVSTVAEARTAVLDSLELNPKRRAVVEKSLTGIWTEKRIFANSAAALEKQLSPQVLDAALLQMTPEVQAMVKAGTVDAPPPAQLQGWIDAVQKHPDAQEREVLARRIAAHLPQPGPFKELLNQVADVLADAAQVATGSDELRAPFRTSMLEGAAEGLQAMGQKEAMVSSTLLAYREHPTASLRRLAEALDSEAGRKLQQAALASILAGATQTRRELVDQLERDLKAGKKK